MDELLISHYVLNTRVLGPGERSAIWVSGCCFDCDGCIAKEMNKQTPERVDIHSLAEILEREETEGITISGGEPFLQSEALLGLIRDIRAKRDYGVIVYTGYVLDQLRRMRETSVNDLLSEIDILIDGRYEKEKDDGKPYRGSSNQNIILLSERYRNTYQSYYQSEYTRNIEIRVEPNHIYMVGVPSEYGLKTWRDLKKRAEING